MKPIVDSEGRPYYVNERDLVTAESVNAMSDWTRQHYTEATKEHNDKGHHVAPHFAYAVLHLNMSRNDHHVGPYSFVNGKSLQQDPTAVVISEWIQNGEGRLKFRDPLPPKPIIMFSFPVLQFERYIPRVEDEHTLYIRAMDNEYAQLNPNFNMTRDFQMIIYGSNHGP